MSKTRPNESAKQPRPEGRPSKPAAEKASAWVGTHTTEAEKRELQAQWSRDCATGVRLSWSAWIRVQLGLPAKSGT